MKRLREFAKLYRIYRHRYHCLNAARYAWVVATETRKTK